MFIHVLSELARTATAPHREEYPRHDMTYEWLVHVMQDEGNSARANIKKARERFRSIPLFRHVDKRTYRKSRGPLLLAKAEEEIAHGDRLRKAGGSHDVELHLANATPQSSLPTSEFPSSGSSSIEDAILDANNCTRFVRPKPFAHMPSPQYRPRGLGGLSTVRESFSDRQESE